MEFYNELSGIGKGIFLVIGFTILGFIGRMISGNSNAGLMFLAPKRKKCHECKSWIDETAKKCKNCGSSTI